MTTSHIIACARTPIGRFLGGLATITAPALGGRALAAVLERCPQPLNVENVIMGQVVTAGAGQAPARQAATHAGLSNSVGAVTVNKVCGSGLYSAMLADALVCSGTHACVLAGGMESMSQAPHLLRRGRSGWKFGSGSIDDALQTDGLVCARTELPMGAIAERLAQRWAISRQDQDAWALESHRRAAAAMQAHHFDPEIVPVCYQQRTGSTTVRLDEAPRSDASLDALRKLPPAFTTEYPVDTCTVTAGNASSLADGAAALMIVDRMNCENLSPQWSFRIVAHAQHAGSHEDLFTAPIEAVRRLLSRTGRNLADIDLLEINEAFAAQTLACMRGLEADPAKINVHGGAIALGHPIGASGARLLVTLIHALLQRSLSTGIAALCIGGGEAVAMLIERDALN